MGSIYGIRLAQKGLIKRIVRRTGIIVLVIITVLVITEIVVDCRKLQGSLLDGPRDCSILGLPGGIWVLPWECLYFQKVQVPKN